VVLRQSGQLEVRVLEDDTRGTYVMGLNGNNELDGFTVGESDLAADGMRLVMTPVTAFLDGIPGSLSIPAGMFLLEEMAVDTRHVARGVYGFDISFQPDDVSLSAVQLPVEFRVGVGLSEDYWPASTGYADFWTSVDGFGWVYDYYYPEVSHAQHGWLSLVGEGDPDVVFYDYAMDAFAYTTLSDPALYPWIAYYLDGEWQWHYYIVPSAGPRWFWTEAGYVFVP
jgi:hypothetical protein